MSSDECWVLGLSLCMFLNKSLATFNSYVDCWVAFTPFRMDFEVVLKLVIYSIIIQVIFQNSFSKKDRYRYSWYQSLSLELELARIGSSDLGGLCVCEGPCRWISEFVWVLLVTSWFLSLLIDYWLTALFWNWPLDCYWLIVTVLLFGCYFVINLLVYVAN